MRKAIVSVLLGKYDTPKKAPHYSGWDYYLFTDQDVDKFLGWKIIKVETKDPKKDSRYYKWMTHETLPNYDLVCYMDASMTLRREPIESEVWFKHPVRNNVVDEGKRILLYYPELKNIIDKQLAFYERQRFKDNYGLFQNGFFIRKHTPETNKLCEKVYKTVKKYCYRDQLALPFALYKTKYEMSGVLEGSKFHLWANVARHL